VQAPDKFGNNCIRPTPNYFAVTFTNPVAIKEKKEQYKSYIVLGPKIYLK